MKIAWLTIYGGLVERGAEILTKEVSRRLAKHHEVTVFQGGSPSGAYPATKIAGVVPLNTDVSSSLVNRFLRHGYLDPYSRMVARFAKQVLVHLATQSFDVVIPSDGGWETVLVRRFASGRRAKCVVIGMAGVGYDDWWNLRQSPDLFVSLSSAALSWARRVNPRVPVTYIPPGVDTTIFSPHGAHIDLGLQKPVVLCVAALVPYKRIDRAIRAAARLVNVSLLVVGTGPLKDELGALGKRMLGERFACAKFNHEDMPRVFRSADTFTLPSASSEAFGIAYLEAMASGLGVVAPDDVTRRHIVGKAGILVDVENEEAYAQALTRVIETDFEDIAVKQAGQFEWDKIAKKYDEALISCVSA